MFGRISVDTIISKSKQCNHFRVSLETACEQGEGEEREMEEREGEKGSLQEWPKISVFAGDLCHVQINYLSGNHNSSN